MDNGKMENLILIHMMKHFKLYLKDGNNEFNLFFFVFVIYSNL